MRHCPHSFALRLLRLLLVLACISPAALADNHSGEYEVKAVLMSKILDFVSWPEASADTCHLCIAGDDPFGKAIDQALAERSGVSVERLGNDFSDVSRCQLLYVSDSKQRDYQELIEALRTQPVLTISDIPRFANNGGMINLALVNRRVRFIINQQQLERSGIKVSSKLLRLADIVESDGGEPGRSG